MWSRALSSGSLDGSANSLVRPTTADIAGHTLVNLLISRLRRCVQQRYCLHDLARLAVSALRNIMLNPRLLNGMKAIYPDPLDRSDMSAGQGTHRCDARPDGLAVLVHGTSSTQGHPASKFRSREPENIAEVPEQGHFWVAAK